MLKVNLNEIIKVKYTDYGRDIYYHRFDDLIARGALCLKPSYPKVDADGYSEIQLWEFMQIFGPHIRMGMPELITESNSIYLDECGNDFREAVECKEERRIVTCEICQEPSLAGTIRVWVKYDDNTGEFIADFNSYISPLRPSELVGMTEREAKDFMRRRFKDAGILL